MITKQGQTAPAPEGRRARRTREPLDVRLSVAFRFGDEPQDRVTVMDQVRVPMVDSVFANRDRIVRGLVSMLVATGLRQPKVVREIAPVLKLLRRK